MVRGLEALCIGVLADCIISLGDSVLSRFLKQQNNTIEPLLDQIEFVLGRLGAIS